MLSEQNIRAMTPGDPEASMREINAAMDDEDMEN